MTSISLEKCEVNENQEACESFVESINEIISEVFSELFMSLVR